MYIYFGGMRQKPFCNTWSTLLGRERSDCWRRYWWSRYRPFSSPVSSQTRFFGFTSNWTGDSGWWFSLGVRSVVLEQAESLRTGGTSLTLFKNGWRVLDAISVGPQLRTQFLEIEGYSFFLNTNEISCWF